MEFIGAEHSIKVHYFIKEKELDVFRDTNKMYTFQNVESGLTMDVIEMLKVFGYSNFNHQIFEKREDSQAE